MIRRIKNIGRRQELRVYVVPDKTGKKNLTAEAASFVVIFNPPGKSKSPQTPNENLLSTNYPPWFRELKKNWKHWSQKKKSE
jgi:hypothetical protein